MAHLVLVFALKLLTYCRYPGEGVSRGAQSALFLLKSRPRGIWVQKHLASNLITTRMLRRGIEGDVKGFRQIFKNGITSCF